MVGKDFVPKYSNISLFKLYLGNYVNYGSNKVLAETRRHL